MKYFLVLLLLCESFSAYSKNPLEIEVQAQMPAIQARYDQYSFMKDVMLRWTSFIRDHWGPEGLKLLHKDVSDSEIHYINEAIQPLAKKYSWGIPNDQAITTIAKYGPIVEIGSGSGYWASLIHDAGVDIIAFDNGSYNSVTEKAYEKMWFNVSKGDQTMASKYPQRTLFLCWPVKTPSVASQAVKSYRGKYVIYVGENSPNGATADKDFFSYMSEEFEVIEQLKIPQWPGYSDALTVYRRKKHSSNEL